MQTKDRSLMLAGTMSLLKRPCSPLSKLKETRGMVTVKRVPDIFEQKNALVQKELPKTEYEFKNQRPHEFKNYDTLLFNQKDFRLRTKPDPIDNPHNLSVFEKKLKSTFDREQAKQKREEEKKALEGKDQWVR
jgi:hypothetical protein